MVLAYIVTLLPILKFRGAERRAIAIECGVQNPLLGFAIMNFSFGNNREIMEKVFFTPLMYSLFTLGTSLLLIVVFNVYSIRKTGKSATPKKIDSRCEEERSGQSKQEEASLAAN